MTFKHNNNNNNHCPSVALPDRISRRGKVNHRNPSNRSL